MLFDPVCLEEDRAAVVNARAIYRAKVQFIYEKYNRMSALAAAKGDAVLRSAARDWLVHAEMIVATDFDRIHLEAQVRHRLKLRDEATDRKIKDHLQRALEEIRQILKGVKERNQISHDAMPEIESRVKVIFGQLGKEEKNLIKQITQGPKKNEPHGHKKAK